MNIRKSLIKVIRFSPVLILALICSVILIIDSSVFSFRSIEQILVQCCPYTCLALSVMVWMISGNMDMSASYGSSLYVLILGNMLTKTNSLAVSLLTMWGVALLVGLFNGIFVGIFDIPSFIVTLGSMSILQGVILVVSSTQAIMINNAVLRTLGSGKIFGFPILILYTLAIIIIVWAIMKYTQFGANVYALGSNINAAKVSGVNIARQQIKIFIFSAFFTSMTSIALAARVSVVSPSIGGSTFLLNCVASCILGGVASTGGKGTVPGVVVGTLIITVINFTMTALGVPSNNVSMVQGGIIILSLALDTYLNRLRNKLEMSITSQAE